MLRRRALALILSGVSVTALAACGEGAGMTDTAKPEPEQAAKEAAPAPTAEPTAAPEPTAVPTAAPEQTTEPTAIPQLDLPVLGDAPEINLTKWLNSDPISMASLQGKSAALVVFWTYT